MQVTSLDETANVSWVDAVVTKGFAPEETHTQQIPTWTIPGYTMKKGRTSGTDAAHLQDPETLTLGAWGRELDVHFTLGVRDMTGMKFARDEGNHMCMADRANGGNNRNGDMGYQDDYFKCTFTDSQSGGYRAEYQSSNGLLTEGTVFYLEGINGAGGDWPDIHEQTDPKDRMVVISSTRKYQNKRFCYVFKRWDPATGKAGSEVNNEGSGWTTSFDQITLMHFDHRSRLATRTATGNPGADSVSAVYDNGWNNTTPAWNRLLYQPFNTDRQPFQDVYSTADYPSGRTYLRIAPDTRHLTGLDNVDTPEENTTCAKYLAPGTKVRIDHNNGGPAVEYNLVDAGDNGGCHKAGGGQLKAPWWASGNNASSASRVAYRNLQIKLQDGEGEYDMSHDFFTWSADDTPKITGYDVSKFYPDPWTMVKITFNTATTETYGRDWAVRLPVDTKNTSAGLGCRYATGHETSHGAITDQVWLGTNNWHQYVGDGPDHLVEGASANRGGDEYWGWGLQLYKLTTGAGDVIITEDTIVDFAPKSSGATPTGNLWDRADGEDPIDPHDWLAIPVEDHDTAIVDALYSHSQFPGPFPATTPFLCTASSGTFEVGETYTVDACLCAELITTTPLLRHVPWKDNSGGVYSQYVAAPEHVPANQTITHYLYKFANASSAAVGTSATFTVDPLEHKEHTLAPMTGPGNDPRANSLNLSLARYVREIQLVEYTVPALAGCVIVTLHGDGSCLSSNPQCDFLVHNIDLSKASLEGEPFAVLQVMGGKLTRDYDRMSGRYGYAYRPAYIQSETQGTITQAGDTTVIQDVNTVTRAREEDEVVHRIAPEGAPFARVVLGVNSNMSRFSACNAMGLQLTTLTAYVYERYYNTVIGEHEVRPCPYAQLRFRLLIDHGS